MKHRESGPFPFRVFGIGMNKTGTSSLGLALKKLGVRPVATQDRIHRAGLIEAVLNHRDFEPALRYARAYRAFEDRPWNVWDMYRRLDERYPGSRFILTVRPPESWWRSVHRWITVSKPHVGERYRLHLQAASLEERDMLEAYERFNQERLEYFRGRSDFIVFDVERGDGWDELCAFLGLPSMNGQPFPHANAQRYDASDHAIVRRVSRAVKQARTEKDKASHTDDLLGVNRCVKCGAKVPKGSEEKRRPLVARLPMFLKLAYRSLQRRAFVPRPNSARTLERVREIRRAYPQLDPASLAVVTTFFNPGGYRSRVRNYQRFRESLALSGVPLLTVELAFGNDPVQLEIGPDEGIQLRAHDVMWQKERLLNLGIRRLLDKGYRAIAWLDADIVFEEPEYWPWFVLAELERSPVCQVFGQVLVEQGPDEMARPGVPATRYFAETGARIHLDRRRPTRQYPFGYPMGYSGFGWAARGEVLEQVPLYDRAVVGGGDKLIQAASHPLTPTWEKQLARLLQSSRKACPKCGHTNAAPAYRDDYLAWARRWNEACGGRAGYTELTIRSLFHGVHRNRFYTLRRDILLRHEFDPANDLAREANGCWRWASAKPGLHHDVANYFFERREDA